MTLAGGGRAAGPGSRRTCVSRAGFGGMSRNGLDEERRTREVGWARPGIAGAELTARPGLCLADPSGPHP